MVRQLTAIMFADMVGYTALMQRDERRAKADRDRQRAVLEASVERHGGRILQFYGDGTLSVFQSAVQAVLCAVEVQAELRREPRVPLRIGIHTGDVVHDADGVFGDGVNVAARVQGLSVPGGILVSDKVADEIKNQPEVTTRSLGNFHLKNVRRAMEVHAVVGDGLAAPAETELTATRARECRSVAVLPFVNMSPDPDNEFFSDGITEEIINALTRVNGLQVTARTSSFAFKGRNDDVRDIAGRLGVNHVLEGSVRKAGPRVRITAQLIDARDGYHVFSETWDRGLDDIFTTQDEIARAIVRHVEHRFSAAGAEVPATLVRAHVHDTEAYAEYLRGRFQWNRWVPEGMRKAIEHYTRSAGMDPDCALPWVGLAGAWTYLGATGQVLPRKAFPEAKAAAERALAVEEGGGDAHMAVAVVKLFYDWDFDGAYHAFQRALSATPGSADVHHLYAMYLRAVGEIDDAIEEVETALRLDPLSLPIAHTLSETLLAAGNFDRADAELARILEMDPAFRAATESRAFVHALRGDLETAARLLEDVPVRSGNEFTAMASRGYVYGRLGRVDDVRRILELLARRKASQPDMSVALDHAIVAVGGGDRDEAFRWLDRAVEERLGGCVNMNLGRVWEPLREDPRWSDLVRRVGLPVSEPVA